MADGADANPTESRADISPEGDKADINPAGGEAGINLGGDRADINPTGGEPDVNPMGGVMIGSAESNVEEVNGWLKIVLCRPTMETCARCACRLCRPYYTFQIRA